MQVRIITPQKVNYFYDQAGRRLAESFRQLGVDPLVGGMKELSSRPSDLTIYTSISEIEYALNSPPEMKRRTSEVRKTSRVLATLCMDCVQTPWYARLRDLSREYQVDTIIDLGLCEQIPPSVPTPPEARNVDYRFLFNGLTPSEFRKVESNQDNIEARPIPWAFIGHYTEQRVALVDYLVEEVHPSGFAFLPPHEAFLADGKYHLNEEQYGLVLSKSKYQLWCSHHHWFYMEPERFRTSLLSGCLPVKVVSPEVKVPEACHFSWLVMTQDQLDGLMIPSKWAGHLERFTSEFLSTPSLAAELQRYCHSMGLTVPKPIPEATPVAEPALLKLAA